MQIAPLTFDIILELILVLLEHLGLGSLQDTFSIQPLDGFFTAPYSVTSISHMLPLCLEPRVWSKCGWAFTTLLLALAFTFPRLLIAMAKRSSSALFIIWLTSRHDPCTHITRQGHIPPLHLLCCSNIPTWL